jgi:Tol biopolymer transport system component
MPLAPGDRLGPYEIVASIGAGGMGEVWRARDPRIGRDVAVKIVTQPLANSESSRRFEQEVRAAGALNHPNILVIYDVGTHNGRPYLVSELLEGVSLRERLQSGPLKAREAIDYAAQVARGLAAAHQKGIVHRDLKPDNLFLTRDGRVKILDFGLARLNLPASATGDKTSAPTLPAATDPGVVMGTVGYMSPEQVRGVPADNRSDLFAFGATLYEMLSGQRAFRRETAVETLNAILKEDAPEPSPDVPPLVARVIQRCLEKDPERRFQSASDLAFALESLSGASTALSPVQPAPSRRWLLGTGAAVAGIAGAFYLGRRGAHLPEQHFQRLTFRRGFAFGGLFAPDGQVVVYGARWEDGPLNIFSTRPGSAESRPLEIPPARLWSVSRKGELAVVLQKGATLARVPLAGGTPREVLRGVLCADWAPDGASLLVVRREGPKRNIEFPIGHVLYETTNVIPLARLSPDGRRIAFFEAPPGGLQDAASIQVVDAGGGRRTLSSNWGGVMGLVWSPDGREILFSGTADQQAPAIFSTDISGVVRPILKMATAIAISDISRDGRALFTSRTWRAAMMYQGPDDEIERDLSWLDFSIAADLSPDGNTILFEESHEGAGVTGRRAVTYIRKTDGSPAVALGEGHALAISPDGEWAAAVISKNPRQLNILPCGPGEPRTLKADRFRYVDARWFPDGKRLLIWGNEDGRLRRHFVQDTAGGVPRAVSPEGAAGDAAISPDGEWIAAQSGPGLFLFPTDGAEPQPVRGDTAGLRPVAWSADGASLYVERGSDPVANIDRIDLRSGKREPWKQLLPVDPSGGHFNRVIVTPDGRSHVYSYERYQSDLYLADGLV